MTAKLTPSPWPELFLGLIPFAPIFQLYFSDGDRFWLCVSDSSQIEDDGLAHTGRLYSEIAKIEIPGVVESRSGSKKQAISGMTGALAELKFFAYELSDSSLFIMPYRTIW